MKKLLFVCLGVFALAACEDKCDSAMCSACQESCVEECEETSGGMTQTCKKTCDCMCKKIVNDGMNEVSAIAACLK